jgi:methyl-accepting chemotaxis protein
MYDISGFQPDRKEIAIGILIVVAILVVCFSAGYLFGLTHAGKNIHDNGDGVNNPGEQLGNAINNQQQITDGIHNAEHTSNSIAETSTAIAESAQHITAGVNEAAGIIDSSQQILGNIRNRGEAGKTPH